MEKYKELRAKWIQDEETVKKSKQEIFTYMEEHLSFYQSGSPSCEDKTQQMSVMEEPINQLTKAKSALNKTGKEKEEEARNIKSSSWMTPLKTVAAALPMTSRNDQSRCQRCAHQEFEILKMNEHIKQQSEERNDLEKKLKQKDEELRNIRKRAAESVSAGLKPDNVDNMNSPVNQSRLQEIYNELKVKKGADYLNWLERQRQQKDHIKDWFVKAYDNMKSSIDAVCGDESMDPQVQKFRQKALENLQLVLFHSSDRSKQNAFQAAFPQYDRRAAEIQLASEFYWLGCLMALHSPPLRPHFSLQQNPFPEFK